MPNIIELNLLDNKSIVAKKQGIPLANENSYKIIAGEENATIFKVVSIPNQYKDKSFTIEMVNAKGYGIAEAPIADINNYEFYLPVGMAVAGYSYILFRCKYTENRKDVVVPFQPLKVKVWNTIPEWKEYITNQTNARIENGYLILEENGVEHNLGYVKGEKGDSGDIASQDILDNIEREINDLYIIANETVTGTEEVTGAYTIRQTANGLSGLIDGALTKPLKITGDTVAVDGVLKHAYFKGVKSTGRNLFNPKSIMVGKNYAGVYFPPRSTSETIKIENQQYYTIKIKKFPKNCDRYEVNFYEADKKTSAGCTGWQYTTDAYSFTAYYVNSRAVYASITFASFNDIAFQESDFSDIEVYWVKGDTIEKEEPYTEDTSFAYTEAQGLKEWDYLLPQEGKKVEQTKVVSFDGTEDWFMEQTETTVGGTGYRIGINLSDFKVTADSQVEDESIIVNIYKIVTAAETWLGQKIGASSGGKDILYVYDPKYCATNDRSLWKAHLSELAAAENPLTVAYKTATVTETDLKPEKASYLANDKGQEIVDEGETKNSEYGAECAIKQLYAVKKGVSE